MQNKNSFFLFILLHLLSFCVTKSFAQNCPSAPLPYQQDFNSNNLPTCWTRVFVNQNQFIHNIEPVQSQGGFYVTEGSHAIRYNHWQPASANLNKERLISEPLDASNITSQVVVQFLWHSSPIVSNFVPSEAVQVQYSIDGGNTWLNAGDSIPRCDSFMSIFHPAVWTQREIVLPANANVNNLLIAFEFTNGNVASMYMDRLRVFEKLYCSAPKVKTGIVGPNFATFNWPLPANLPDSGYEYVLGYTWLENETNIPPTGTISPTDTSVEIQGLSFLTPYFFLMRAVCTNGQKSSWTTVKNIETPRNPLPRPWTEDFDTYYIPFEFSKIIGSWQASDVRGVVGNPYASLNVHLSNSGEQSSIVTPSVATIQSGDVFSLEFKNANYTQPYDTPFNGSGMISILISDNFGYTYQPLDSFPTQNSGKWSRKIYSLNNYVDKTVQFKLIVTATNGVFDAAFDNLYVGPPPACYMPNNVSVMVTSTASALMSWDPVTEHPAIGYEIYCNTLGIHPPQDSNFVASVGANTTSFHIENLIPHTTYYAWVRTLCSSTEKSSWAYWKRFYTGHCIPHHVSITSKIRKVVTSGGIENINNPNAGIAFYGYNDYYDVHHLKASPGTEINVTLNLWSEGRIAIFADLNNNYLFDYNERLYLSELRLDSGDNVVTINLPDNLYNGEYRLRILSDLLNSNLNACENSGLGEAHDYKIIIVNGLTSITPNTNSQDSISVYPNPSPGKFTVAHNLYKKIENISVYNLLGSKVFNNNGIINNPYQIDCSFLSPGIYFLHIQAGGKKIIKKIQITN